MNSTPNANRVHIAIYGKTNSGKSSLLNAIIGQDISIVSDVKGTTTDPVFKNMELIPFGPVVFIDTAGLDDESNLGTLRVEKSLKILQRTDFAIYVLDIQDTDLKAYHETIQDFKKYNIPYMTVFNKMDTVTHEAIEKKKEAFDDAIFVSALKDKNVLYLKDHLIKKLQQGEADPPIVGDLIPYNGTVVMVVPIDSEAPKGRIILPQVQLIRDCLDHGIKSYVVRDTELEGALKDIKNIDLVVTDSQAFKKVNEIVPSDIKLTSFSILFARYKGDLDVFVDGIKKIKSLDASSRILISESCTHNHSHEDIGRVKIPMLLNKHIGKELNYDFKMGHDFPKDLSNYDYIIHCGSCMVNKKTMMTRLSLCKEKNIPITNYGVLLADLTGILSRSIEIFKATPNLK
ncbi:[FeFe] hydrogenase H-cluster maturation GTPase HydF [Serpentinicella sp. ANB-PHB4]|uniref:[FeFe] hydrogenase H-cluster maturation GTPase HydF n=1 Tax=Serpentinicella sp. ANB-PHB4 TaxID=3074076 RepID=UPI00285714B5|nr:[FeFe] hydrogenase H-cluster maturation GTPase HydF [Serpentinicella sp. ANB-PHB4]MDR5658471.1 [FeFe] hydrogenase H-cluster maturation GTPase HydF [Serpentinicella sp. ANB-PHB4]